MSDVNPLRAGLASDRISEPCSIVIFGAGGDLAKRMLLPAIYNLRLNDVLPTRFGIIGFSRSPLSDEEYRNEVKKAIDTFSRGGETREPLWSDFAGHISYVSGTFDDLEAFKQLKRRLDENDQKLGTAGNRLFYLSTPPTVFAQIVQQIHAAGLGPKDSKRGWSRIVIEKPFGTDPQSARALQAVVSKVFDEQTIYRIDHYLGKEPVQDIMALRFANMIFEPIWNRRYVDSVRITAAETLGVEGRGAYYERVGALRDMIQNHVMNLLALVAMEPPVSSHADSIRDEKFKVLSALRPIPHDLVHKMTARGQYGPGLIDGKPVVGYREEADVDPNSTTETYAAVKFLIDNWRWAGVPFYVRSGKRLGRKNTEIIIQFLHIPHRLFGEAGDLIDQNTLIMKIQPEEGVSLRFNAKVPGPKMHIRSVSMDFNYGSGFGVTTAPAYERLIADAVSGDATLFTRWDAVQTAWDAIAPILDIWQIQSPTEDFPNYVAGTQGPTSAEALLLAEGRSWRKL